MKLVSCSMSLLLADDSAKETFWDICEKSKSLSGLPRNLIVSCELSTDLSWLVRVLRMRFLKESKLMLSLRNFECLSRAYISFSSNCSMTDWPFDIVSSCLLQRMRTGTDDKALSARSV